MDKIIEYAPLLWAGTKVTIALSLTSLAFSLALGLLGAWGKLSGSRLANRLADAYTTIIRGIPDLCLMLLLYYGGQQLLNRLGEATGWWGYLELHQFTAGVLALAVILGAYMTETFRGAFLSIRRGELEAAEACGMSRGAIFRRIIFPQLIRYALPGLGNNWMVLLKSTSLVSVIGLQDVVWQSFVAGRATRELFAFFLTTMVIYLILTALSDIVFWFLRRRYQLGVRSHMA